MKTLMTIVCTTLMMSTIITNSEASSTEGINGVLITKFGTPTYKQTLHYRKMYEKKPFPDAKIYYYDNGVYKIISQGENHYGLYVISGSFEDQTYTVRYISLPSEDWGHKTAFHQLTFINEDKKDNGVFIQNAITDTGEAIEQQNGTFAIEKNIVKNPIKKKWRK